MSHNQTQTLAWHGSTTLKAELLARMRAHLEADEFEQNAYRHSDDNAPSGFRGCFLGCSMPNDWSPIRGGSNWRLAFVDMYGIPLGVVSTIERLFDSHWPSEGIGGYEESPGRFAVEVVEAIPVRADLSRINALGMDCHYEDDYPQLAIDRFLRDLRNAPVLEAAG